MSYDISSFIAIGNTDPMWMINTLSGKWYAADICKQPRLLLPVTVLNFTSDWAEGSLKANTTYKSFSNVVVKAEVGLHVGLYGVNITLRGQSTRNGLNRSVIFKFS